MYQPRVHPAAHRHGIQISMDGKGCWRDNVFVERLWKSLKYEEVYVHAYDTVNAAHQGLERYLTFYNQTRPHQALDGQTPDQVYYDNLTTRRTAASSATRQAPLKEGVTLSNQPEPPLLAAPFYAESGHGFFSLLYCARKEITPMKEQLTAVFQQVPEGYIAFVEELPGANTQGNTLDEARTNLQEAVQLVLESNRALAEESLGSKTVIREHLASIS